MDFIRKNMGSLVNLIFTLTFAMIFIGVLSSIVGYGNAIAEKNNQQARAEEYSRYAVYDDNQITGTKVISAVRQFSRVVEFYVYIKNSSGTYGIDVSKNGTACFTPDPNTHLTSNSKSSSCTVTKDDLGNESHPAFVPLNGLYDSIILRDTSGRISGLYFTKQ